MKRISMLLALASVLLLFALPAKAQSSGDVSIFNPVRLSVGARVYRNFDEVPGAAAGSYASQWWAGLPLSWQITGAPSPYPVSIIGAIDVGIPEGANKAVIRSYIGVGVLLKAGPR